MCFEIGSINSFYEYLLSSSIFDQCEGIKIYETVLSFREFSIRQKKKNVYIAVIHIVVSDRMQWKFILLL